MFEIVGQVLVGWLAADFLTGAFHFFQDRYLKATWPIVGKWIGEPNELHHRDPMAFTHGSFAQRNLEAIALSLALGAGWITLFGVSAGIVSAMVAGCLSTQIHLWAHKPRSAPKFVKALQQAGVFQSPAGHARHHRPPSTNSYCIVTDWLNPFINLVLK